MALYARQTFNRGLCRHSYCQKRLAFRSFQVREVVVSWCSRPAFSSHEDFYAAHNQPEKSHTAGQLMLRVKASRPMSNPTRRQSFGRLDVVFNGVSLSDDITRQLTGHPQVLKPTLRSHSSQSARVIPVHPNSSCPEADPKMVLIFQF